MILTILPTSMEPSRVPLKEDSNLWRTLFRCQLALAESKPEDGASHSCAGLAESSDGRATWNACRRRALAADFLMGFAVVLCWTVYYITAACKRVMLQTPGSRKLGNCVMLGCSYHVFVGGFCGNFFLRVHVALSCHYSLAGRHFVSACVGIRWMLATGIRKKPLKTTQLPSN